MFTDTQSTPQQAGELSPRKFMFERSFDAPAAARAPERKPVTLKPEQYDALKKESYDQGFAAGHKTGLDEQTGQMMALLARIGDKIDHMAHSMDTLQRQNDVNMRQMAITIARKFVPELASRHGVQEIEALLSAVIAEMIHEPRLVVRINESQFDCLNEKITTLAAQKAYAGKVVILADAEIAAGDCLIEWADGGMERNSGALWNKIEQVVTPQA